MGDTGDRTGRLRRRGSALEDAIVDAAWAELSELGYSGASMSGIAKRAGTSKPVLYRRWGSQPRLFLAVLKRFAATVEVPDTGDVREDLACLLDTIVGLFALIPRDVVNGLLADTRRDPELFNEVRTHIMRSGAHEVVRIILARGSERGQVDQGKITPRIARLPIDLVRNEYLMADGPLSPGLVAEIVDDIFLPLVRADPRPR